MNKPAKKTALTYEALNHAAAATQNTNSRHRDRTPSHTHMPPAPAERN